MKKIIYIALLAISASLMFTSCTEESVTPKTNNSEAGNTSPDKGA